MCGIFGYKGEKEAGKILLEGIKKLEYRGYDSVGIATVFNNNIEIKKDIGKIEDVDYKLNFKNLNGKIGIAHTRWSTHGKTTKENAHPHLSNNKEIAVVHNGIIENYKELKEKLIKEKYKFYSETDTEVIPILIEKYCKEYNIELAVKKTLRELKGSFAIIVIDNSSNKVIAAKRYSPLILGIGENEFFISSDFNSFIEHTRKVIFMEDNEMIVINDDYNFIDLVNDRKLQKSVEYIDYDFNKFDKGNFEHYMLKEIYEQPETIKKSINYFYNNFRGLSDYKDVKRIVIVGCGTSYYAGLIGKFFIESLSGIPVEVDYASEFRYRNPIINENDLVLALSQSGETADTVAAVKEAKIKKAKIIAICNVPGSSLTRISNLTLYTQAGVEICVASTKAFTCNLIVLYLFSLYLSQVNKIFDEKNIKEKLESIRKLPLQIEMILRNEKIKTIAENNFDYNNSIFIGRGVNYPIALEGALKLKEISYIHAEGCPAAEMKHGHIALINDNMPIVAIAVKDKTYDKIKNNIEEMKSRGGRIISIASEGDNEISDISDDVIFIPKTSDLLYPFLTIIPLQLLAYYIGKKRGCDVDKPRNLAKSVTVE